MGTIKKASSKAISFCGRWTGQELRKSTTWEQCADILMEHFSWDVYSQCASQGDMTIIRLYKEMDTGKDELIETWTLPNKEVFREGDWDWPYLHRILVEYLMKNIKKLLKPTRTRGKIGSSKKEVNSGKETNPIKAAKKTGGGTNHRANRTVRH